MLLAVCSSVVKLGYVVGSTLDGRGGQGRGRGRKGEGRGGEEGEIGGEERGGWRVGLSGGLGLGLGGWRRYQRIRNAIYSYHQPYVL